MIRCCLVTVPHFGRRIDLYDDATYRPVWSESHGEETGWTITAVTAVGGHEESMLERSHTVSFRPRARLVSVLGEHLISDPAVGLVELVKNAYDADADEVVVELRNLADPTGTSIAITDNGCGMTLGELTTRWLSPAVDHKERAKRRGERTQRGRLPIGEKGVGRFAVHHLGRRLLLVTRAADSEELVLEVDWDRFDDGDVFLDGLQLTVVERPAQLFQDDRTGTCLEVTLPRDPWTETLVRKVHRTLKRLQSPLQEGASEFAVRLVCPEYPELQDVSPTDMLERSHYEFRAVIQPSGECDYEYVCRHPAVASRTRSGSEALSLDVRGAGQSAECGPFWLNLYVWDRSARYLQASNVSGRELDAHCGVSLFRDGLRVFPYGEPGDDWLFLDQERVQAPADRIGNNQVVGLVLVDQSSNLQLRDKTNREGLIENRAFEDLRALVRSAIRVFTTYWRHDRPARERSRSGGLKGDVETARAIASAIEETARDDIQVRRPASVSRRAAARKGSQASVGDGAVLSQRNAVRELVTELDGAAAELRDERRQRDVMRQLAATGLAAERVVHEFGRQVSAAMLHMEQLERMARTDAQVRERLSAVAVCLRTLRNEFRVLAPYESAGRADRTRPTAVSDAVNLAIVLNQYILTAAGVDLSVAGDNFTIRTRPAAVVQILDNVIHNASHWVATGGAEDRRIQVVLRPEPRQILVADSGPGVHDEMRDQLFEPFTTLKADGTGLGLFVSASLARSLGCTLRLAEDTERPEGLGGACFVLGFADESEREEEPQRERA